MQPTDPLPLTIGNKNCEAYTGASWKWVMQFARAHGVPVWGFNRLRLIPARELLEALRAAVPPAPMLTEAEELAAIERQVSQVLTEKQELARYENDASYRQQCIEEERRKYLALLALPRRRGREIIPPYFSEGAPRITAKPKRAKVITRR